MLTKSVTNKHDIKNNLKFKIFFSIKNLKEIYKIKYLRNNIETIIVEKFPLQLIPLK